MIYQLAINIYFLNNLLDFAIKKLPYRLILTNNYTCDFLNVFHLKIDDYSMIIVD